ncbi:hypothetical protein JOC34_002639 [Virgibacillus halotolerans]|uniref:hypothetical protein n=1 Tax=Virgibacillus halotolerans TaxID=1071053 RepID=UPI00195F3835|nr:hypothetical protein [Virgibacillus halotolerans]MBM7600248.1 hypothetical protein [Virgibacillus halotolerans]
MSRNDKSYQDQSGGETFDEFFKKYKLSPQQIAVITAILFNVLEVNAVLIDKDQLVEVSLIGSLKRKSRLDKLLDEISDMPVKDVWNALNDR